MVQRRFSALDALVFRSLHNKDHWSCVLKTADHKSFAVMQTTQQGCAIAKLHRGTDNCERSD